LFYLARWYSYWWKNFREVAAKLGKSFLLLTNCEVVNSNFIPRSVSFLMKRLNTRMRYVNDIIIDSERISAIENRLLSIRKLSFNNLLRVKSVIFFFLAKKFSAQFLSHNIYSWVEQSNMIDIISKVYKLPEFKIKWFAHLEIFKLSVNAGIHYMYRYIVTNQYDIYVMKFVLFL